MSAINEVLRAIEDPSRDNFCDAFESFLDNTGMSDLEVAQKLQISRPTVRRWASGQSCVHPVGRPPVLRWMLEELTK